VGRGERRRRDRRRGGGVPAPSGGGREPGGPAEREDPAASNVLNGTNDVTVDGDVETYPIWKLTGPFTSVLVRDVARALQWTLTANADPGETWTIDCRKGRQGVFDDTGARSRGRLSADAFLWGLEPGVSQVSTTVAGGADGTKVVGDAPSRWESY
jgi:hypothetical protein